MVVKIAATRVLNYYSTWKRPQLILSKHNFLLCVMVRALSDLGPLLNSSIIRTHQGIQDTLLQNDTRDRLVRRGFPELGNFENFVFLSFIYLF